LSAGGGFLAAPLNDLEAGSLSAAARNLCDLCNLWLNRTAKAAWHKAPW